MTQLFTYNPDTDELLLMIKVKAPAKKNSIEKFIEIDNKNYLKINIAAIPEHGKANSAIIDFLSAEWQIHKKYITIISGLTSHFKILSIKNISIEYLNSVLNTYI